MKPRFLLDGMLGSLAGWLRICGYDSVYYSDMVDDNLLAEAKKEDRILLTRDKQLFERSDKNGVKSYYVPNNSITKQLSYLCRDLGVTLTPSSSRCSHCNAAIVPVDKESLKDKIPVNSYRHYDDFWICTSCGKIFWKGSHWKKILETLILAKGGCEQDL